MPFPSSAVAFIWRAKALGSSDGAASGRIPRIMSQVATFTGNSRLLVKPQGLNSAAEFLERVDALFPAAARVADEIVVTLFAADHDEVGDAVSVAQPDNHRISFDEVPVDQE